VTEYEVVESVVVWLLPGAAIPQKAMTMRSLRACFLSRRIFNIQPQWRSLPFGGFTLPVGQLVSASN
jgi:hypothetical protein